MTKHRILSEGFIKSMAASVAVTNYCDVPITELTREELLVIVAAQQESMRYIREDGKRALEYARSLTVLQSNHE